MPGSPRPDRLAGCEAHVPSLEDPMMVRPLLRPVLVALAALACAGMVPMAFDGYVFRPIPTGASVDTEPYGITNQGLVAGDYADPDDPSIYHGFLFQDGQLVTVDDPAPGVIGTFLYQGNERGQVAVSYQTADGKVTGSVFDLRRGSWSDLPSPKPASVQNWAGAINDRGQVFGNWYDNYDFLNAHGWVFDHGNYTFFDVPGASPDNVPRRTTSGRCHTGRTTAATWSGITRPRTA
jgi:hypothetical protein